MTRIGTSNANAELAVTLFKDLLADNQWGVGEAWLAICKLLMTCEVWDSGGWHSLFGLPVLMERNNYRLNKTGTPNRYLRDAQFVADFLAKNLQVSPALLCAELGIYFKHPRIYGLQPNNLRGHAFRSVVAESINMFGDSGLLIREEVSPHDLFPGYDFGSRSKDAKIDIVATRDGRVVALITVRWTYRHDRVDIIDEARAYMPAARAVNPSCAFYGVTAEFVRPRLQKVIDQTEPVLRHAAITRLVHVNAEMPREVIGNDGVLSHMISLAEMVRDSANWR